MFRTAHKIILASASPRRRAYFKQLGLEFELEVPRVDETPVPGEAPCDYVERIARRKSAAVLKNHPADCVISADTTVFLGDRILGKPASEAEAMEILMFLRGREHRVATAFSIECPEKGVEYAQTVVTRVTFSDFSEEVAKAYVLTGEPSDKAGAYGIQGSGGILVARIDGSYSNVVGLPLNEMITALTKYGIVKII